MTDEQMAALRAAAEKATPGPWAVQNEDPEDQWIGLADSVSDGAYGRGGIICNAPHDFRHSMWAWDNNAAYIALANPAAVLALLDRVAAAEAQLERADTAINILHRAMIGPGKVPPRFKRPINEARAALGGEQETQR